MAHGGVQTGVPGPGAPGPAGEPLLIRLLSAAVQLPLTVLSLVLYMALRLVRASSGLAVTVLPRPIVGAFSGEAARIERPRHLRGTLQILLTNNPNFLTLTEQVGRLAGALQARPQLPAATAAGNLKRELAEAHGLQLDWQESSWEEAATAAAASGQALFVYHHSSTHEDTPRFIEGTLKDPSVLALLSHQFVLWAGDIHRREGFALAAALGATRFPFTALLAFPMPRWV